jgi:hypothetical protein
MRLGESSTDETTRVDFHVGLDDPDHHLEEISGIDQLHPRIIDTQTASRQCPTVEAFVDIESTDYLFILPRIAVERTSRPFSENHKVVPISPSTKPETVDHFAGQSIVDD